MISIQEEARGLVSSIPFNCTTAELAGALGVNINTVIRAIRREQLKCHRTPGGHRRIPRDTQLHIVEGCIRRGRNE